MNTNLQMPEISVGDLRRLTLARIEKERVIKGKFSNRDFERDAGLPKDSVRKLLEGYQPLGEKYLAFINYLCKSERLLFVLEKGGIVQQLENTSDERINEPLPSYIKPAPNLAEMLVPDDSFYPRFQRGDIVYFYKDSLNGFASLTGRHPRICKILGNGIIIAYLREGTKPGHYNLATLDHAIIPNVLIEWCANIEGMRYAGD